MDPSDPDVPEQWRLAFHKLGFVVDPSPIFCLLRAEAAAGRPAYPPRHLIYRALELTPPASVRVVIMGQDPYFKEGEANGLSFSVARGRRIPPSLRNVFEVLRSELGGAKPTHGDLKSWADQGVLLLNEALTVQVGKPRSHRGIGWSPITDAIIRVVAAGEPSVFVLWGEDAKRKKKLVDDDRHCVITSSHPCSRREHRTAFLAHRPFEAANRFLERHGRGTIDWLRL